MECWAWSEPTYDAVHAAIGRERKAAKELSQKAEMLARRPLEEAVRAAVEREREVAAELRQRAEEEAKRKLAQGVRLAVELERKTAQAVDDAMRIFDEEQGRERAKQNPPMRNTVQSDSLAKKVVANVADAWLQREALHSARLTSMPIILKVR